MTWEICSQEQAEVKCGYNANTSQFPDIIEVFYEEAVGQLCTATREDWVTNYNSLKTAMRFILGEIISDMIAMKVICWDLFSFPSLAEAQTMLDYLKDEIDRNIKLLKDEMNKEAMWGTP